MEFPVPDSLTALWQDLVAIPHIGFYLTAGWAIYLVWLSTWIVLQKREPVATLSWLFSLALLPYIGFLIYFFFGPQRIHRHACVGCARAPRCRRRRRG